MNFAYEALDSRGGAVSDRITAETEEIALRRLQEQGYIILALKAEEKRKRNSRRKGALLSFKRTPRIKLEQIVALTREFAIMIETGVPILEALLLLQENTDHPGVAEALAEAHEELAGGRTLSQALSSQPKLFPKLYVDMVRTAEAGGSLDETLGQAADYQEASLDMRRKVKGAMTYPCILLGVAGLVLFFMLTYLVPQFSALFARMNADIPVTTRLLFAMSDFLRHQWWMIPFLLIGLGAGIRILKRIPVVHTALARITLRLPMVGDLIQKIVVARILRALGTLTAAGVPLLLALETASQVSQHGVFESAMTDLQVRVERGDSFAESMRAVNVFPAMVCQMAATGEKSGRLSEILLRVAQFYEKDVDARLKALASIIEPLMIVILGVLVGFIAVSIITPIYSLVGNVK